jgi:hypothetical protein
MAITMDGTITDPNDGELLARPVYAARLATVSPRTIYHWIKTGRVRVRYAVGGAVLVEVKSLFTQQKPDNARVGRSGRDGDLQPAA